MIEEVNFFAKYAKIGRNIDQKIENLQESWDSLNILHSGSGENEEDTFRHVENFLSQIEELNNQLVVDNASRKCQIEETDIFINNYQYICQKLMEDCEDIESLFVEYGYTPDPIAIKQETCMENSILTEDQMNNLTLECSVKPKVELTPEGVQSNPPDLPKFIATPVIKSVASVSSQEPPLSATPRYKYPLKPLFSPFYHNSIN